MFQSMIAVLLFSSVVNAQSVDSGIWRADSSLSINGIPLPPSQDSECITKEEAKDIKKTILKELKKHGCESTKWTAKGKQLEVSLKCAKDDLEATGTLKGSFTEKSYTLSGDADGSYKGIPSEASLDLKGKWTKACSK